MQVLDAPTGLTLRLIPRMEDLAGVDAGKYSLSEMNEKLDMTPGDITMMLNETPGLRVQTTSPSLGGANVRVQGYVHIGIMVERRFGPARLFVNAENLLDVRQTSYDPLVRPSVGLGGRWTTDVWAPLDGRVANLGIRLDLAGAL